MILFCQATCARAYPRLAWMFRHRSWLLQETLLPLLSVAAFAYAYEAMNAPREFVGYVVLGAAMTTFWMNVLWSLGAHLYWERDTGNLELYIMSPAPMASILAGMAIGGMATTLVRALAILLSGVWIFNVPFAPSSWGLLVLVFVLTLTALYGLGMMFASLFLLWGREAWHIVNALQEPVYLLTGMNFPVKVLGTMLHQAIPAIMTLIPLTLGMDAMRQVLFRAEGYLDVTTELILLGAASCLFLFAARHTLRLLERLARQEGRLSIRWQ